MRASHPVASLLAGVLLVLAGCGPDTTPRAGQTTASPTPVPLPARPVPPPVPPPVQPPAPPAPPGDPSGVEFGTGWEPVERDKAGATFRWMGTRSTMIVYGSGDRHVEFSAASLAKPRTLTIRLRGRVVARAQLPRVGARRVSVAVPAAPGAALLELEASPGASPAAAVSPGDRRLLAVQVSRLAVSGGATTP